MTERAEQIEQEIDVELKEIEERLYRIAERLTREDLAGRSNLVDQYAFDAGTLHAAMRIIDVFFEPEWREARDAARGDERLTKALAAGDGKHRQQGNDA